MIELNKIYSTRSLAEEGLAISYGSFRNYKKEYEEHLAKFYEYTKIQKGNGTQYTFTKAIAPYISYKEYKTLQKNTTLQKHIKDTIYHDDRQTGSNIARIIYINGEIQALDWELSTLSVYVRDQLRDLVKSGYYKKDDYRWCILDKKQNKYILMPEEEVKRLREFFYTRQDEETEENIWTKKEEGELSAEEADKAVGELRLNAFMGGRFHYQEETGNWPIKVPVYTRTAWINESES